MVWSWVKNWIKKHNHSHKTKDVLELTKESFEHIPPDLWANCVRHVLKEEANYAKHDGIETSNGIRIPPIVINPVIIPLGDVSSDDSDDDEDDDIDLDICEEALEAMCHINVEDMIVQFFRPALSQTSSQLNGRRQNAFTVYEPHYPLVVSPPNSPIHGGFEDEDEVMLEGNDQENDNNDQPQDENENMIELSHCEMPFRKISPNTFQCLLCFKLCKRHCGVILHMNSHKNTCEHCGRGFPGKVTASILKRHEDFCQKPKKPKTPKEPKEPKPLRLCQYCEKTFQFKSRRNRHETECWKKPK
jgi:hypothetical protein